MVKKSKGYTKPGNFSTVSGAEMRKKLFFSDTMWYSWERTQNFAWEGIS